MYKILIFIISIIFISCNGKEIENIIVQTNKSNISNNNNIDDIKVSTSKLTSKEHEVLINKGTEFPFTGELLDVKDDGVYTCKLCGSLLFKSDAKFNSGTGWPSFDDAIAENILGHVFYNEGFTDKQTRYCINSVSLNFINKADFEKTNDTTNK